MQALILAAGRGTRLRLLTYAIPTLDSYLEANRLLIEERGVVPPAVRELP